MRAIVLMFDSLNRHMLSPYADTFVDATPADFEPVREAFAKVGFSVK